MGSRIRLRTARLLRMLRAASRLLVEDPRGFLATLKVAALAAAVTVAVRTLSLKRGLELFSPRCRSRADTGLGPEAARMASRIDAVLATGLPPWTPVCWKRAILLHHHLRSAGFDSRLVFGVRRPIRTLLEAHAWVEVGGSPVFEPEPPPYQRVYAFPEPR